MPPVETPREGTPPDELPPRETLRETTPGETLPGAWPRLAGWALAVLLLDQVTKAIVYRALALHGPPRHVLGDLLRLTYIHNAGSALGLFGGNRWFFIGVSLLSILVILALVRSGRYRDRHLITAFGLILGGAAGALPARLWLGQVIDFIEMGIAGHYWPVYNVADIGITAGVILLGIRILFEKPVPAAGIEESPR
jgi:signal peptidase II